MFDAMTRRHIPIVINGTVNEKAILTRSGGGHNVHLFESEFKGTHPLKSALKPGDQLYDKEFYYLVQSVRKTPSGDKSSMLLKCNQIIDIKRLESTLDENLNPVNAWITTFPSVKVNAEYVTGALREKEPGLLANTVLKILMQKTPAYTRYDDQNSDFAINDRIVLGTSNYQVTAVDAVITEGLLTIQVAQDVRQ